LCKKYFFISYLMPMTIFGSMENYEVISVWQNLSVVAATLLMSLSVGTAAQALTFTNPTTGNQYFLTTARSSWNEAQAEAVVAGGNLVTINDAEEQSGF
jgi:hypothetical protein